MNRPLGVRDLLVVSAHAVLVVVKALIIVLALHFLASHFNWPLFSEAGGSVVDGELDPGRPTVYGLSEIRVVIGNAAGGIT